MFKITYIFLLTLLLSACGKTSKTKNKISLKDTLLIEIKRFNRDRGVQENHKIDQRDYKIIKYLDTLANNSFYANFHLDNDHQVSHLSIYCKFDPALKKTRRLAILEKLQYFLFASHKFNLAKLENLQVLSLYLGRLDLPIVLKFPKSLKHIKGLTLVNTPIQKIEFTPKNELSSLRLISCKVIYLDSILTNLSQIQDVFLMNNNIQEVQIDTNYFRKLEQLDLSGNPIQLPIDTLRKRYPSIQFFYYYDKDRKKVDMAQ